MMAEFSWLTGHLDPRILDVASNEARHRLVYDALRISRENLLENELDFSTEALQLLLFESADISRTAAGTRELSREVFGLARTQVPDSDDLEGRKVLLRTACIGWLADQAPLASKLLYNRDIPVPVPDSAAWSERVTSHLIDAWLLLLRKRDWEDIDSLFELISALRSEQQAYEREYLNSQGQSAHPAAWQLVSLYHLARAAEILASYLTSGQSDQRFDPRQQVESHFDRAAAAADLARDIELSDLVRLLNFVAAQLLDNSIWTVARAAGPTTSKFVANIVSRSRTSPIFEVLPPQREALSGQGLARAAQRSVVVSLPTSSGKTLIAQFRMLQALSLFDAVRGWVAYVAPTRALVNQITTRLRRDFGPLGIVVERVSPALEIDGLEAGILSDPAPASQFRVLVTTPEKLDLMLRVGWESRIERPLCLVVVDEAHNLATSERGIKLELLLATINRESRDAQFLLLTPFIRNAREISQWLDPTSNQIVQLELDWQPNDRIICLSKRIRDDGKKGSFHLDIELVATSRNTLVIDDILPLGGNRPMGYAWSTASAPTKLAAATSRLLEDRGGTITLAQRPDHAWSIAEQLMQERGGQSVDDPEVSTVQRIIAHEFGAEFPLVSMLGSGIGVHHSGLSDEIRVLMEWLLETDRIHHLVATTTVAQGVNFPVANVVFATHQYPYGVVMPPSDFWNIAGRAGRVDQGEVGVIAFVAPDEDRAQILRDFIGANVEALNSTLVDMVKSAIEQYGELNLTRLSSQSQWSAFVQFLAHTYRQIDNHEEFAAQVEQVLRGTLGFQALRSSNSSWAASLVASVRHYSENLSGKPLSLVDSTGFSWESVSGALGRLARERIDAETWNEPLFGDDLRSLRSIIGIMLEVPELRASLVEAAGNSTEPGHYLAGITHDWVNGASIPQLADDYFRQGSKSSLQAITRCCQRIFGGIAPTVAWGLSALQSLSLAGKFDDLPAQQQRQLRNLPSFAFYGVGSEEAVALRLLGVPRGASAPLASLLGTQVGSKAGEDTLANLSERRRLLRSLTALEWQGAMGTLGRDYYRIWQIIEGTL